MHRRLGLGCVLAYVPGWRTHFLQGDLEGSLPCHLDDERRGHYGRSAAGLLHWRLPSGAARREGARRLPRRCSRLPLCLQSYRWHPLTHPFVGRPGGEPLFERARRRVERDAHALCARRQDRALVARRHGRPAPVQRQRALRVRSGCGHPRCRVHSYNWLPVCSAGHGQ